jgi:hypothetical protein
VPDGVEVVPVVELTPVTTVEVEAVTAVMVSPELVTITREAEASAKRQSSTKRDVDLDFLKRVSQPLESRDVVPITPPPVRQEYEGCDFDPIRQEVAPPAEPVESSYLTEWNAAPKKW